MVTRSTDAVEALIVDDGELDGDDVAAEALAGGLRPTRSVGVTVGWDPLGWSELIDDEDAGDVEVGGVVPDGVVTDSMPDWALMRRSAASAGSMAARASWTNMWKPGVSMRLMRMPFHSAKATALDMVMRRAISSSS